MGFGSFKKIKNYSLFIIIIILLLISTPQVQPINASNNILLKINSLNNTELSFNQKFGQYQLDKRIQEPIEIGQPVNWKLLLTDGMKLYGVDYQTDPVIIKETETLENGMWNKSIVLSTNYLNEYKNITLKTKIKPLKNLTIKPNYVYNKTSENELQIEIPHLIKKQKIEISGFLNETQTRLNFTTSEGLVEVSTSNGNIVQFELEGENLQISLNNIQPDKETKLRIRFPYPITANTSFYTFNELESERLLLPYKQIDNNTIELNPNIAISSFSKLSKNQITIYATIKQKIEEQKQLKLFLDKTIYQVGDLLKIRTNPKNTSKFIYLTNSENQTKLIKNNYRLKEPGDYQLEITLYYGNLTQTFYREIIVINNTLNIQELKTSFGVIQLSSNSSSIENARINKGNLKLELVNLTSKNVSLKINLPEQVNGFFYLWQKMISGKYQLIPYNLTGNKTVLILKLSDGIVDADEKSDGKIKLDMKLFIPSNETQKIRREGKTVEVQRILSKNLQGINIGRSGISSLQTQKPDLVLRTDKGDISKINLVDENNFPFKPTTRQFKNNLLKFKVTNLTKGETITVNLELNTKLSNPTIWKFNPNKIKWYKYPLKQLNATTVQIQITDGGLGDDDGIVNGIIEDDLGITDNWWNDSWQYRQEINITNTDLNENISDYQVELDLTNTSVKDHFIWDDNSSIRFTQYNKTSDSETELPYYILSWNRTEQTAKILVKVKYIPAANYDAGLGNGRSMIFMYYNNSAVSSESNASATYVWFDDFSKNTLADYKEVDADTQPGTSFSEINGYYNLTGSGADTWNSNDEYAAAAVRVAGDFDAQVKILSQTNTNSWAKAGIMIKNNVSGADSSTGYVFMTITPGNGYAWQRDENNDGELESNTNTGGTSSYPGWVRIVKLGTDMSGYYSLDGKNWILISKRPITSADSVQDVAMALTSHDNTQLCEVHFDNFIIKKYVNATLSISLGNEYYAGLLNITIDKPENNIELTRNTPFTMNGTVICKLGNCQSVNTYYQYYATVTPTQTKSFETTSDFKRNETSENISIGNDRLQLQLVSDKTFWWNDSWKYREPFNISSVNDLTNYTLTLVLNDTDTGANFNFTENNSLRFLIENEIGDQEELNYYISYWNSSAHEANVEIKIPFLNSSKNLTIWMYYGNPTAVSESDYEKAFLLADDFSSQTINSFWSKADRDSTDNTAFGINNSQLEINASGADTWTNEDQYASVYSSVNGDFVAITKVDYQENTDSWAKAGIMVKNNMLESAYSPGYSFMTVTPGNGFAFQRDEDGDGYLSSNDNAGTTTYPAYLKLVKSGTTFSGYYSIDGQSWTELNSVSISSALTSQDLGLSVTSHNSGVESTVDFDYIQVKRYASVVPNYISGPEETLNFEPSGEYLSGALDTGYNQVDYLTINWSEEVEPNTSIIIYSRTSPGSEGAWFNNNWSYRKDYNVTNTAKDLKNYQIFISTDLSQEFASSKIKSDCSDVRFTYYNSSSGRQDEIPFYIDYCNLSSEDTADFWVKVPELKNNTVTKVYLYYGNPAATSASDIEKTFSYDTEKTVAYVVSNATSSAGLSVISLSDNNSVTIDSTTSMNEFDTITSSASISTRINATRLLDAEGAASDGTDVVVPISWAGKEFVYGGMRSTDVICMLAPFGDSTVTIYDSGTAKWSGTVNSTGICVTNDIASGDALRINATKPILAFHTSTTLGDSFPMYPAVNETFYGSSVSSYVYVASDSTTTANCYGSDGTTETLSIAADDQASVSSITSGSQGTGVAIKIVPNGRIGVIRQADSDGYESSVLVPRKEMSTKFGSSLAAEYISVVSYINNTNCTVRTASSVVGSALTNNSGTDYGVYKACFGCGDSSQYVTGAWELTCDHPVWAYYEKDATDDETNLFGYKQMRQYVYPEPSLSSSGEITKEDVLNTTNYFQWSSWFQESNGALISSPNNRYIQFKAILQSNNSDITPKLYQLNINYKAKTLDWNDMESSGTFFETSNPYDCGTMYGGEICTPSLSVIPKTLGNYSLRLRAISSNDQVDTVTSLVRNVSVFLQPVLSTFTSSKDPVARNSTTNLAVYLYDEAGQPMEDYNITFVDETANGTAYTIGSVKTDENGLAEISYLVIPDSIFGSHKITAFYQGDSSKFIKPVSDSIFVSVSSQPKITNISENPKWSGFGNIVNITANISDDRGLSTYKINITDENGVSSIYDLTHSTGDIYYYVFSDYWKTGIYNFTITASNIDGISTTSEKNTFRYSSELLFNFTTNEENYMNNQLVKLGTNNWYYDSNPTRKEFNISNTAGNLSEYQIFISVDFSDEYNNGNIQRNCSDVRFTYYNSTSDSEEPIPYYIDFCNLAIENKADFWVKVPELKNNTVTKVYLYYGGTNTTSLSNIENVFTYSTPKTVAYVVSSTNAQGLDILSLENNNTIYVGSTQYNLDNYQMVSTGAVNISDAINATKLFNMEGHASESDIVLPISWAGKEFYYGGMRGTDEFCMLAPFGNSTVTVYDGASAIWTGTISPSGSCITADVTSGDDGRIIATKPILVFHQGTDSWPFYPATTNTLYGPSISNYGYVASGSTASLISYKGSSGTSGTANLDANSVLDLASYLTAGASGTGESATVKGSTAIGAIQQADSDGGESTVFAPRKEMSTRFGSAQPVEYIVFVTPTENTTCTLFNNSGSIVSSVTVTGSNGVYKGIMGADEDSLASAGWELTCDHPVWAYYEEHISSNGEETNLLGYKQMRQYAYPEPTVTDSGVQFASGLQNLGSEKHRVYLRMQTQKYSSGSWTNIIPPIVDQYEVNINPGSVLNINRIWNENGAWNTSTYPPGAYRVFAVIEDDARNTLLNTDGSQILGYSYFNILNATLSVSNLTFENKEDYSLDEYETGDTINWINVTVFVKNNTAFSANLTLNILDDQKQSVSWGPNETKYCGDIPVNSTCEQQWNNSGLGYKIPSSVSSGTYVFYWNVNSDALNAPAINNQSLSFKIYNMPSYINGYFENNRINKPNSTTYFVNITNPWTKNLTNVVATINCPLINGLNCSNSNNQITTIIGNIQAGESKIINYTIEANESVPSNNYDINITLNYTNPGEEFHSRSDVGDAVLEVRNIGILEINVTNYPLNVTRGYSTSIDAYMNNTGDTVATNTWLNYTLPLGWNILSGVQDLFTSSVGVNEIIWNNISLNLSISSTLGPQDVRIDSSADDGRIDFKIFNIVVYAETMMEAHPNRTIVNRGEFVQLNSTLKYDNGTPVSDENITFKDLTTGQIIGYNLTNSDGIAVLNYYINETSPLGIHDINVSSKEDNLKYIRASNNQTTIDVHEVPSITDFQIEPYENGYDQNFKISATIFDADDIASAKVWINRSDGKVIEEDMDLNPPSSYYYNFNDTWTQGIYQVKIIAEDTTGAVSETGIKNFTVNSSLLLNVLTQKNTYSQNEQVNLTKSNITYWWNNSWKYRVPINVSNNYGNLTEYQIFVSKDFSTQYSEGKINKNCSDVRFTYYNSSTRSEEAIDYYTDFCDLDKEDVADFWVKIPVLQNDTTTKIYLYYGNKRVESESNITKVFTYKEPKTVAYVDSNLSVNSGVNLESLADNNNIVVDSANYDLNNLDVTTLSSLRLNTSFKSTDLFSAIGSGNTNEMMVPVSWAGTEFVDGGMRGADVFCLLSPFGDASVTIYDAGSAVWSGTITSAGSCIAQDITTGDGLRITSSIPILALHESTNGDDSFVMYPATSLPIYGGSNSGSNHIATGENSTTVNCYGSDGSTDILSIPANSEDSCSITSGTYGTGAAIKVKGNYPIGGISQADGNGVESTVYVPRKEMGTVFGSPYDARYLAIATVYPNVNCSLYTSSGYFSSNISTGSSTNGIYKISFNVGTNSGVYITGPWKLECTKPVWGYFENLVADNDETNMLGYKQMRQFVYPTPKVDLGSDENKGSLILNRLDTNSSGYLLMKVQKNVSGVWTNISTVVDDLSTGVKRTINSSTLDLSSIWDDAGSWNTGLSSAGYYRIYAELRDNNSKILISNNGIPYRDTSEFEITKPSLLLNISDLRIYDVTNTESSNWHIYTNDLVGEGLNSTYTLYGGHTYRFEVDIDNIGDSIWDINKTNITYSNFDTLWLTKESDIWYSDASLMDDRRSDTSYEGGSFSGKVVWNTSKGGQVATGDSSTFFLVINLTSVVDKQVDFNVLSSVLNISDYSTLHLVELDTKPPVLYNNIYNITPINVTRGSETTLFARWNETIALANFTYTTTSPTTFVTYTNDTPQNPQNWTNYTFTVGSTWYLGLHTGKIIAKDESENINNTLPYLNFTVFGTAELDDIELNSTNIKVGQSVKITCKVIEKASLGEVENYTVTFRNSTSILGANSTNSSGWASFIYQDTTPESENISCQIQPNLTKYYVTDDKNFSQITLNTIETEPPKYAEILYPQIAHRGETIGLKVHWTDNYKLSNSTLEMNSSGIPTNVSTIQLSGSDDWANFSYQVPTSTSLGNISWKQYAEDIFANRNQTPSKQIEVWGYSKVSSSSLSPASMQEGNSTIMSCKVIDANTTEDLSNYQVNFYYKNSTETSYNLLGSNITNSSGWSQYKFVINTADTYTVLCNITDDASKLYNKSTINNATQELNVVSGSDVTPPSIVGNNYTINTTEIYIGDCFEVSGLWDESINESYVQYNNSPTITQVEINPPYTNNWTNVSICTNASWSVGNYSIKLFAKDQAGNLNNTLDYKYLQVKNRVSLYWNTPTGNLNRTKIDVSCKVVENFTGDPVENYEVKFYDGNLGFLIGTNYTNSSGIAQINYDFSSSNVGPDDLTCTIAPNSDYDVSGSTSKTETVTFYGYLNATINEPQNQTIIHRTQTTTLNATVLDEFQNIPKDETGAVASLNANWYDYQQTQIASGEISSWTVPFAQTLGPQELKFNVSQNYYYPDSTTANVTIFGYANVTLQEPKPKVYGEDILLNITCLVRDANNGQPLESYTVNTSQDGTILQSATTNSSGQTNYQINTDTLNDGNYEFMCEIGNETSIYYDKTTPYMSTVNVVVDKTAPGIYYNPSTDESGNYSRNWTFINVSAIDSNLDQVVLNWNGSLEQITQFNGTNYWINKTGLQEGIYYFNVTANDSVNHKNTTETRRVVIDLSAPIVTIFNPENNSVLNDSLVYFNVSISDLTNVTCKLQESNNGGPPSPTSFVCNSSYIPLSEGNDELLFTVTDALNHTTDKTIYVFIDLTKPEITVNSPVNGTTYKTKSVDLNYTVADNHEIDSCWYNIDSQSNQTLTNCENTTLTGLTNEWHNITVYVNDTAGNINQTSILFEVNYSELVTTAVYPVNNSVITKTNISLNASTNKVATDCNYTLDGTTTGILQSTNNLVWYSSVNDLSQGDHNVSYSCTDGLNTSTTGIVNFKIDSLGPQIIFVTPTPANGSAAKSDYVYVNVSLSEAGKNAVLEWTNSSGSFNLTMTNSSSTSFWYNMTNLSDATYTYKVFAQDIYGNENVSEERKVIVSTGAPVIFLTSPVNNELYNTTIQDLNVSASKPIQKWVFQLNKENFTFQPNKTIASAFGNNTLTVWATDIYGNTGKAQVNYSVNASEWLDTFGSYTGLSTSTNLKTGSNASTLFCWPALSSATTPQDNPTTCWPYRRSINLSSSPNLTNYQVRLDLNLSAEYSEGKLNNDCSDLRFTYSNNTLGSPIAKINYWVENCSDKSDIKVWLKLPIISSSTQVQLYYGNKYAHSESNGTEVFNFFDEMDTTDSAKWGTNIIGWNSSESEIYPIDSGTNAKITASYTTPESYATELWFKGNSSSGASGYFGLGTSSYYLKLYLEPSNNRLDLYNGADNYYTINVSKEQKYTLVTDFTNNDYQLYINDLSLPALSLTSAASGAQTEPVFYPYYVNGLTIDRIAIRSYSASSPSISSMSPEERPITNTTLKSELLTPESGYWDTFKASVTEPTGTTTVFKILDENNNSLCGNLTSTELNTGYKACSAVENKSIYLYAELGTDEALKTATIFNWSFNWSAKVILPDLYVESIKFLNTSPIKEGDLVNVSINISNNASTSANNFNLTIERSLYNGTKLLQNTTKITGLSLNANSWKQINLSWQTGTGTYIIDAIIDPENRVIESNETNNNKSENMTVSIWQIIYGNYTYNLTLQSNIDKSYYDWSTTDNKGTLFYADADSSYNYGDLKGLNGTDDLKEADIALNVSGYQDSISRLFDKNNDGIPDKTITATIGGNQVSGIPIINTTNTSSFVTGILYDSADGISYNGNQDLVFITFLNSSKQGKFGVYDFEIRIPSTLKSYEGSTNSIEQTLEVN